MNVNIMRPVRWVGGAMFEPVALDEPHAFACGTNGPTTFDVEFAPPADMPRMMAIIAGLQDDGESKWLLKYLYLERREQLRPFSRPIGAAGVMATMLMPVIVLCGRLAGWERLVGRYSPITTTEASR